MTSIVQPRVILLNYLRNWGEIRLFRFIPRPQTSSLLSVTMVIEREFYLIHVASTTISHFCVSCWRMRPGQSPPLCWQVEMPWYERVRSFIAFAELRDWLNTLVVRHLHPRY